MEMGKFAGTAAATLLAVALAGPAYGGEGLPKGGYVGASVGYGIFKFWSDEVDDCATSGNCRTDDDEIVYSVYGGFEFSPYVAIEAGYAGHKALKVEFIDFPSCSRELSTQSVYVAAVGRPPIDTGRVRPFGKAGIYWWKSEDESACGSGVANTFKDDDMEPLVGAGVDIEVTERTSLRAEWVWFTESDGVHAFLYGLNFKF